MSGLRFWYPSTMFGYEIKLKGVVVFSVIRLVDELDLLIRSVRKSFIFLVPLLLQQKVLRRVC